MKQAKHVFQFRARCFRRTFIKLIKQTSIWKQRLAAINLCRSLKQCFPPRRANLVLCMVKLVISKTFLKWWWWQWRWSAGYLCQVFVELFLASARISDRLISWEFSCSFQWKDEVRVVKLLAFKTRGIICSRFKIAAFARMSSLALCL